MRIDKWLWAARFFKTRTLAAHACDLGRIEINKDRVKPAKEVRVGDELRVVNEGGTFVVRVLSLRETRGPASEARSLYAESDASQTARVQAAEARKLASFMDWPEGKPSKKDRRQINRARGRF